MSNLQAAAVRQAITVLEPALLPFSGVAGLVNAARALRDLGDGFVAVLLPVYLATIGLGPLEVGIVATLALVRLLIEEFNCLKPTS